MDTATFLHSIMTLITFITFVGIVFWAWSRRRKSAFDEAANAPFALPDDAEGPRTHEDPPRGGQAT